MKRIKVDELTWLAFLYGEQDRAAMADAWPKGSSERAEAESVRAQMRKYRMKRWGRTAFEAMIENAESKPLKK